MKFRMGIVQVSILLFIISLTQDCYCTDTNCSQSFIVLLLGWALMLMDGVGLIWLANPLLIACWFTYKKHPKASMLLSVFSTLLALFFLMVGVIADNEGGIKHPIVSYKAGYWLWLMSHVTMLIATFYKMLQINTEKAKHLPDGVISKWRIPK